MNITKTTLAIATLIASTAMSTGFAKGGTAKSTWLHCGSLIDTQAGEVLGEHFIQITGNKVSEVTTDKPATN
jgi:putative Mn2+ efflux pump MntP